MTQVGPPTDYLSNHFSKKKWLFWKIAGMVDKNEGDVSSNSEEVNGIPLQDVVNNDDKRNSVESESTDSKDAEIAITTEKKPPQTIS